MMDKKIELEKTKASKKPADKKPATNKKPAKKKTVAEEARDLGLLYVGGGKYVNLQGQLTHLNENGVLKPYDETTE